MKPEDREEIVKILHEIEVELRVGKANAYAGKTNNDTLGNFKRNAERWGMTKYQTWGIYFGKHIDTIEQAIKENPETPTDPTEGLLGRINDARVYLEILACMLTEDDLITIPGLYPEIHVEHGDISKANINGTAPQADVTYE